MASSWASSILLNTSFPPSSFKNNSFSSPQFPSSPFLYNSKNPMSFNPSYMSLFPFEKFQHYETVRQWMGKHWHWSIYFSLIYFFLILIGQRLMQNRQPYKLRTALTLWNLCLASFSAFAFVRSFPELWDSIFSENGSFHHSLCFLDNHNSATSLYGWLFALSKVVEFGDTAFIILRKQSLIFLHWWHHITVCLFCWFAYSSHDPTSRWFADMNLFVHALMYTYYAARSLQIKLPKTAALSITCLQLSQMVVGIIINGHSIKVFLKGEECHRPIENVYAALAMYMSYFVLFAHFFYKAYVSNKNGRKVKAE